MDSGREIFKADRNQLIALVAMLCAFFLFAMGEIALGAVFFVAAAVLSLGGLFWNAHRQDRADAADEKASSAAKQSTKTDAAPARKD